jgi:formate dehydrogenase major subunit
MSGMPFEARLLCHAGDLLQRNLRFADVILPASPSLEKEGTFTSTERRIQRLYEVFEPLDGSRPDWKIIQDIANRLGANWKYEHPSQIYEEIASLTPLMAGVTYERLEGYKTLQWPVAEDGSDQPLLYTKQFNFPDGKATFFPSLDGADRSAGCRVRPAPEQRPLARTFPRRQHDLSHEGIREKTPCTFVEVSPELAGERGIQTGSWVQLTSRYGKVRAQAVITTRVQGKELYMPMNSTSKSLSTVSPAAIRTR